MVSPSKREVQQLRSSNRNGGQELAGQRAPGSCGSTMRATNAQGGVLVTKRDRLALILFCAMATLGSKKF